MTSAPAGRRFEQMSLDELDEPLRDTTFTVVDLETTGGRAGTFLAFQGSAEDRATRGRHALGSG